MAARPIVGGPERRRGRVRWRQGLLGIENRRNLLGGIPNSLLEQRQARPIIAQKWIGDSAKVEVFMDGRAE